MSETDKSFLLSI